jgi:hypothetical protein
MAVLHESSNWGLPPKIGLKSGRSIAIGLKSFFISKIGSEDFKGFGSRLKTVISRTRLGRRPEMGLWCFPLNFDTAAIRIIVVDLGKPLRINFVGIYNLQLCH